MRIKVVVWMVAGALGMAQPAFAAEGADKAAPAAQSGTAAPLQTSARKLSTVEGITEYALPNGLHVLLAPDASKPSTTVNVTYKVGSKEENYGETGMAHLLEHLLFKGTPSLPGKTIVQEFAKRGMRFNGSTFFDRTNYFETFAANDDHLDWALRMEADRMVNSFIARSDLDSEMTVVRNEMEQGENSPTMILWERMMATAYQWHNYGKTTIGARTDVENVKIENLQAFYRQHYQPDNAVLIVTGKFDVAPTLAKIERYFGVIARPTRTLPTEYTRDPAQDGAREVAVSRVGDSQLVGALYHIPPGAHPDTAAIQLLSYILGDTPSGRLHKALVEKKKAASVEVEALSLQDPGALLVFVSLNQAQSRDEVRRILLGELEGLAQHPITEAELKRAKIAFQNNFEKTLSDPVSFGIGLSESIASGDWRLLFLDRDRIDKATLADVQRAAQNYLVESNRTVGQFIPTAKPVRAQVPNEVDVAAMVEGYKGREAVAEGEVFDPSPVNIEQRTARVKLANGMQLALLPKRTRGQLVEGTLVLQVGEVNSLKGKKYLASAVADMLTRGAGKLSRQDIADKLDALKAKLTVGADKGTVSVSFETRADKLAEFLPLLRDILRAPTFPAAEFEQLRTQELTAIDEGKSQPAQQAINALMRYDNPYAKGDVRYQETFDEQIEAIKAIKPAELKAFHAAFYGAEHAQLGLVGDFDAKAVQTQLGQLFGDWQAKQKFVRISDPFRASKGKKIDIETPDKANAFFVAALPLPLRDDAQEAPALALANRILGGGPLKSRLADRLRQKDGLSYSVGSGLRLSSFEGNGTWIFQAIYAPSNLARLQTGFSEEVARLISDGITEQELSEAKSGLLQDAAVSRTQDASLARSLAAQLDQQRTMNYVAEREKRLQAVTVAEVNEVIRRYLDPSKLVTAFAGDFAGAAKKSADKPAEQTPAPAAQ